MKNKFEKYVKEYLIQCNRLIGAIKLSTKELKRLSIEIKKED